MDRALMGEAFELLERFGSLRELQRQLRVHEVLSGRSFEEVKANIIEQQDETAWAAAKAYLADVLLYGSKSFEVLSVSRDAKLSAHALAESSDSLNEEEIITFGSNISPNPTFIGATHDQSALTMIFRSLKTFDRTVDIEEEWVVPEHRNRIAEAEKAYLVESIKIPVLEALEIPFGPRHGSVRTVTHIGKYAASEKVGAATSRLISLSARVLGIAGDEFTRLDLFPAIRNLYNNASEGRVVEMFFDCSTGAVRLERMRRSLTDLRHEAYHVAGINAASINPYRIAVRWELAGIGCVDVTLPGTRRMLHQSERPRLTVAHVSPAVGKSAYLHAIQRVAGNL